MNITLTGASGFIGNRLVARLAAAGHALHLVGRRRPADLAAGIAFSTWDANQDSFPAASLDGADAVIHLAGEPVAQRWSAEVKDRIRRSRVEGTTALVRALAGRERRPRILIAASAIGFYGDRGDQLQTEASPPGKGFLPDICVAWERAADEATRLGLRVVKLRIGVVLGADGGALEKMLPPFRMGAGGPIGDGQQWMSWIHVDDMVGLLQFALESDTLSGAINATSPQPVTNAAFAKALGAALHRPAIFPVPVFALKLLYGEMAEVVLASQRVEPVAALRAGYRFQYPDLDQALRQLLT